MHPPSQWAWQGTLNSVIYCSECGCCCWTISDFPLEHNANGIGLSIFLKINENKKKILTLNRESNNRRDKRIVIAAISDRIRLSFLCLNSISSMIRIQRKKITIVLYFYFQFIFMACSCCYCYIYLWPLYMYIHIFATNRSRNQLPGCQVRRLAEPLKPNGSYVISEIGCH